MYCTIIIAVLSTYLAKSRAYSLHAYIPHSADTVSNLMSRPFRFVVVLFLFPVATDDHLGSSALTAAIKVVRSITDYPQRLPYAEIAWRTINDWLVGQWGDLPAIPWSSATWCPRLKKLWIMAYRCQRLPRISDSSPGTALHRREYHKPEAMWLTN